VSACVLCLMSPVRLQEAEHDSSERGGSTAGQPPGWGECLLSAETPGLYLCVRVCVCVCVCVCVFTRCMQNLRCLHQLVCLEMLTFFSLSLFFLLFLSSSCSRQRVRRAPSS